MLFNSLAYLIFLPISFGIYWMLNKRQDLQNLFLLLISYIFYGWWDYRFLSLIALSSIIDYSIGLKLSKTNNDQIRKTLLFGSLFANLGLLGFFKYFNFFVTEFIDLFHSFGIELNYTTLKIILPVGISFYTFQTLSYTIDVYKKKIPAERNIISFFAYVSFFPQLVAGPIERASNLLPQFNKKRTFSYDLAVDGMRQILWGFFKKVVIADNCAMLADDIFTNYATLSGSELMLGAIYFAFQIYGDFSGYSDIAIGTGKLFGFNLMTNFKTPYFSRDIAEFWRRWHISLSTWFRDYLYIPLGGSRGTLANQIRNVFAIFLVSGFWHGANWTYLFWGFLNAVYFLPSMLMKKNRKFLDIVAVNQFFPSISDVLRMALTFWATCMAWIFFRAPTISDGFSYLSNIYNKSLFTLPSYLSVLPLIFILVCIEWVQRRHEHSLDISEYPKWSRPLVYFGVIGLIFYFGNFGERSFIYFQF